MEDKNEVSVDPNGIVSGQSDSDAKVSGDTISAQPVIVPNMDFGNASNITINFNYNLPTSK